VDARSEARLKALDEVGAHCDILQRLPLVPPSAVIRGLYFRSIENVLADAGRAQPYRELFPENRSALRWYPVADFLERLTIGAGVLLGPARVHEGMFEIGRRNARAFTDGLLGKVMLRVLSRDPHKVLQQAIAGRRQSSKPARWELSFPAERTAVMALIEEYGYIESYLLGGAHGTFEAIDVPVRIECQLEDRFSGKHVIRW
jgi:uncharacterized protein (TIGR02265 family)